MTDRNKLNRNKANTSISNPLLSASANSTNVDPLSTHTLSSNHDLSRISFRPQAKLSVSQPGDAYEQEADKTAQQVMEMGDSTLQREITIQSENRNLQRMPDQAQEGDADPIVFDDDHIVGKKLSAAELERQNKAVQALPDAITRARDYLTGHRLDVKEAIDQFKENAQYQIDNLDGDPSDYWALLPVLAGAIGATVTAFIPGVNIVVGATIAVSVQAAIQTTAVAEIKGSRSKMKEQVKKAMQAFARDVNAGQVKAINQINLQISATMLNLALTNDKVQEALALGEDGLDRVLATYLGIPNPAKKSLYGEILTSLNVQFTEWITRKQLNFGRDTLEKMIGEAEGTDQYKEDQPKIEAAKKAAEEESRAAAKKRGN